jgi:hypothetical protein
MIPNLYYYDTPTHRYAMDPACGLSFVPDGNSLRLHSVSLCCTGQSFADG